jgi:hypothetical protein
MRAGPLLFAAMASGGPSLMMLIQAIAAHEGQLVKG